MGGHARWALAALLALCASSQASSLRYCDQQAKQTAAQQDKLLRVSGIIKAELDRAGVSLAIISRSGLNLDLFGVRYSHAGLSLKASTETRWAVRQLYFACEEQQPRLFDQGLSAFLLGTDEPALGYISLLLLPAVAASALEPVALDNQRALNLLGASYSANAYPYSLRYQNCNQWLIELLASAWGGTRPGADSRASAQGWLKEAGYQATLFQLPLRPALWLTAFSPWLNLDDHPEEDLGQARLRVSMPTSIEAFVRAQFPGAERLEFCHTDRHVVLHRGWEAIAEGCEPGEHDTVVVLD